MSDNESREAPREVSAEVERALLTTGRVFDAITLYGAQHPSVARIGRQAHAQWERVLATRPKVNLSVTEDALLVDGALVTSQSPFVETLFERLRSLEVAGLSMQAGMTLEEFGELVDIIASADRERLAAGEGEGGGRLRHVAAEQVIYRRVRDGEVVVDQAKLAEATGATGQDLEALTAFLQGEGGVDAKKIGQAMRALFDDGSRRVAEVILDGVRDTVQGSPDDAVQAASSLVEQLKRGYEGVRQTSAVNTKKGRQQLRKTFQELEGHLKDGAEEAGLAWDGDLADSVREAIAEISEELQIETLVADTTRTQNTLSKHEQRLLRYISRNWEEEDAGKVLRDRLVEAGLPVALWADLISKAGLSAAEREGAARQISQSMERLHDLLGGPETDADRVREILGAVTEGMTHATNKAEQVLNELAVEVTTETDEATDGETEGQPGAPRDRRRKRLTWVWERLAEMGQELLQPLTVINASLSMTLMGLVGDLNDEQRELLASAEQSAQKLKTLMDRLVTIVGFPKSRRARSDIVFDDRLDGRAGMLEDGPAEGVPGGADDSASAPAS